MKCRVGGVKRTGSEWAVAGGRAVTHSLSLYAPSDSDNSISRANTHITTLQHTSSVLSTIATAIDSLLFVSCPATGGGGGGARAPITERTDIYFATKKLPKLSIENGF